MTGWKLLDMNSLFIVRKHPDGGYELYKAVELPDGDYQGFHAVIRAGAEDAAKDEFLKKASGGLCAFTDGTIYTLCLGAIISASGICGDDPFLKFMLTNHLYDTETLRYRWIDDPDAEASKLGMDAKVEVVRKDTGEATGVKSGEELLDRFESVRLCSACGAPMESGFTDETDYWCCYEEFHEAMDAAYGPDGWREAPQTTGYCAEDYFYEYKDKDGTWRPEPSYWTEWYE